MRAERAVEPTKSENITVTWRRSAASWGLGSVTAWTCDVAGAAPASSLIARRILRRITKEDAEVFQVLIGKVAKDRKINGVFSKTSRVLGHAELFEPIGNLLHGRKSTATEFTVRGYSTKLAA